MRREILPKLLQHHRFVIRPIAQIHFRLAIAFEDDEMRADAVEEPAVVIRDEGGACEFFEDI
jgi:hypothetical protein